MLVYCTSQTFSAYHLFTLPAYHTDSVIRYCTLYRTREADENGTINLKWFS